MRRYITAIAFFTLAAIVLSSPVNAQSQIVFHDDFDDGVTEPPWTIEFDGENGRTATGWDHDEAATQSSWLTARDIYSISTTGALSWMYVNLLRDIPPIGDFTVNMRLSWNSPPLPNDINHLLLLYLYDGSGTQIARGGYIDAWLLHVGTSSWKPCTPHGGYRCGTHTLDSAGPVGTADITMERVGNQFTFTWVGSNGVTVANSQTVDTATVESMQLRFGHFDQADTGSGGIANFGELGVDYITVEGVVVSIEERLEELINILQDIVDANPGPCADKVEDALESVQSALAELTKTPPDRQAALGTIEGSVGDLEAAVDDGSCSDPSQLVDIMDQLAGIARQLAVDAIEDAIAQGGDPGEISEAQQFLDDGDALRVSGQFKDAVSKYKDALAKAESANPN